MHIVNTQDTVLNTKHGEIRGEFSFLDPNVCVLVEASTTDPETCPLGSVFVRNRALSRETNGNSEWMVYPRGVYHAWRVGGHMRRTNGTGLDIVGELQEIAADERAAVAYAKSLFFHDTELASKRYLELFLRVSRHFARVRNAEKRVAEADLLRGLQLFDANGRWNPGAAAMAVGAAIGRLNERRGEMSVIFSNVNRRSFRIHQALTRAINAYESLLEDLGGKNATFMDRGLLFRLAAILDRDRVVDDMRRVLERHLASFEDLIIQPYVKSAMLTKQDLIALRERIEKGVRDGSYADPDRRASEIDHVRTVLLRLRQACAWMLKKHTLEMEIIAPLSWLINEAETSRRAANRRGKSGNMVTRAYAPKRFDRIFERITTLHSRADQAHDDLLREPVREKFVNAVALAVDAANDGDWLTVKNELKVASDVL